MARPELERLREDARQGFTKRLYVYRLDRLSRTGIRDTLEVIEEFRTHGVEVVSLSDGFDMNGSAAEIILAVLAWAAKMERLAINERISATREAMAEQGRAWGRPRRLSDADVARIGGLRAAGKTLREIARAVKVPRSTLADALAPQRAAASE